MYHYLTNPATYVPYSRRQLSDHSPQSHPEWYTDSDIRKEIKMLLRMNEKYGTHILRVNAYLALDAVLKSRQS